MCLYEFVTGVPPFSDDTPEKVFENILALRLEWPSEADGDEPLSKEAVGAIMSFLKLEPSQRIDLSGMKELRFFRNGITGNQYINLIQHSSQNECIFFTPTLPL